MKKIFLNYILPIIVASGLMWWTLKDVHVAEMWSKITSADPFWVGITIVISLLSHISRAYRWNLLMEPLGYKPGLRNTSIAVLSGYFGNIFVPRGGEVVRCVVLNRTNGIPVGTSFATVVAERAFDFFCLLVLVSVSFLFEFDRFAALFNKMNEVKAATKVQSGGSSINIYLVLGIAAAGGMIVLYVFRNSTIVKKIRSFIITLLKEAVTSFRKLKRKTEFVLHTFIIWGGYYLMTYLIFFSLPATSHLGPMAGLVILIVGGFGMAAPASGGIGAFHYIVAAGLTMFYGLSDNDGIAYAFVLHTSQLFTLFFFGGISMAASFFVAKKELVKTEDAATV